MKNIIIKIISAIFALTMVFGCFAACNNTGTNTEVTTTSPTPTVSDPTDTDPADVTTAGPVESDTNVPDTNTPDTEPPAPEEDFVDFDLSKYKIVVSSDASAQIVVAASNIYDAVKEASGKMLYLKKDGKYTVESSDGYEILVGYTNRPESAEIINSFTGFQWKIVLVGNKIVIVGKNDMMTIKAVEYFMEKYISSIKSNAVIKVPEVFDIASDVENYKMISLVENAKFRARVVISKSLNTKDPLIAEVRSMVDSLNSLVGTTNLRASTDDKGGISDESLSQVCEIVVGYADRVEAKEFMSNITPDQYGYGIVGNKIVIAGWTRETISLALEMFLEDISKFITYNSDGTRGLDLICNEPVLKDYGKFAVNIPTYEGGNYNLCHELTDNELEYYITETTLEAYKNYRKSLENAGFKLCFENVIANNAYATYTSNDTMVHVYYTHYEKAVRIITAPMDTVNVPNFKPETYTKVAEPKVTQMMFEYANRTGGMTASGMCYVFTLEDGSYIIYDIGGKSDANAKRLYELLVELNERPDKKIVIAAWILTHEHGDHYGNFVNFCSKYGQYIEVEQFIINTPTSASIAINESTTPFSHYLAQSEKYIGKPKIVKAHTGQVIKVRNAEIEVLFTIEDTYPQIIRNTNDASIITRVKMGGQTVMMLGDTENQASAIIMSSFGNYLKSDIVQIAHHGFGTAPFSLFEIIDSKVALWPAYQEVYDRLLSPSNTGSYFVLAKQIVKSNMFVDTFLADYTIKTLVLPYKVGSGAVIERKY